MRASSRGQAKKSTRRPDKIVAARDAGVADSVKLVESDSYDDYQENVRRLIRATWPYPLTTQALCAATGIGERDAQRIMARQKDVEGGVQWALESNRDHGHKFLLVRLSSNTSGHAKEIRRAHLRAGIERDEQLIAERRKALEAE
jgi:hypothetical protein